MLGGPCAGSLRRRQRLEQIATRNARAALGDELSKRCLVASGRRQTGHFLAPLGDDESFTRLDAVEIAAEVLAQLSNTDSCFWAGASSASHGAR